MLSRSFAAALILTTGTAAAGGSYLAMRHNAVEAAPMPPVMIVPAPAGEPMQVTPDVPLDATVVRPQAPVVPEPPRAVVPRRPAPVRVRQVPTTQRVHAEQTPASVPVGRVEADEPEYRPVSSLAVEPPAPAGEAEASHSEPGLYEIVIPASAVIGLEIENTITSEAAKVEDRVDARVTRDVYADGRLAIPAGSRVIGAVTLVERGGKLKDRARLGVRFHTVALPGGRQVPLQTEAIYREGDSPGAESTKKIGGAAVGGAVLGAILGGSRGAVTGAGVGAAGGTAAVLAGGRNAATLASGTVVTVRLSAPVTLEVERN